MVDKNVVSKPTLSIAIERCGLSSQIKMSRLYFSDKYHFKNYVRKICYSLGISKELFDSELSELFYVFYDFENQFSSFLLEIKFEPCDYISKRLKQINKNDFQFLPSFLTTEVPELNKELHEISKQILNHPDYKPYNRTTYNIDIKSHRFIFNAIIDQNPFIALYKGHQELSDSFKKFIEDNSATTGIYFLYDENKELTYIGKSVSLGNRLISSVNQKGAYFLRIAQTKSRADMHIYEPYFILNLKPRLNVEFQEADDLTLELPKLNLSQYVAVYREKKD